MIPIGVDAEALEAFALHVDVLLGPFAAELAQLRLRGRRHLVGAEGLLDHVLDGLAMAVPSGDVGSEVPALRMAFATKSLRILLNEWPM